MRGVYIECTTRIRAVALPLAGLFFMMGNTLVPAFPIQEADGIAFQTSVPLECAGRHKHRRIHQSVFDGKLFKLDIVGPATGAMIQFNSHY